MWSLPKLLPKRKIRPDRPGGTLVAVQQHEKVLAVIIVQNLGAVRLNA